MNNHQSYSTFMKKRTTKKKLDSPSGTAITTADIILSELDQYSKWKNDESRSRRYFYQ